VKEQETHQEMR